MLQLPLDIKRVGLNDNPSQLQNSVIGDYGLGDIGEHDRHAITFFYAEAGKRMGKTIGQFVQQFITNSAAIKDRRCFLGETFGGLGEKLKERNVGILDGGGNIFLVRFKPWSLHKFSST